MDQAKNCIAGAINKALYNNQVQTIKIVKKEVTASLKVVVEVNNYTVESELTDNLVEALINPGLYIAGLLIDALEEKMCNDGIVKQID